MGRTRPGATGRTTRSRPHTQARRRVAVQSQRIEWSGHPGRPRFARLPRPNERLVFGLIGFLIVLPLWEFVVQSGMVKRVTLSSPTLIVGAAINDLIVYPLNGQFNRSLYPHLL